MEGDKIGVVDGSRGENGSSSDGRPPNPIAMGYNRQCFSASRVLASPCKKSLVRHPSLVTLSLYHPYSNTLLYFGFRLFCYTNS